MKRKECETEKKYGTFKISLTCTAAHQQGTIKVFWIKIPVSVIFVLQSVGQFPTLFSGIRAVTPSQKTTKTKLDHHCSFECDFLPFFFFSEKNNC